MSVKERIINFISYKKLSKSEFCRSIGVSSAFVTSMRVSIQPDKIESIAIAYPELNTGWLLTGEGAMLKEASNYAQHEPVESKISSPESEYTSKEDRLLKIIESQQKTIEKLTELMAQKKQDVYMAAKVAGAG